MNLAIIPARGGSVRIPRKNIKSFFGKPIIAYSITAALESGLFGRVVVSTDDAEIAEIAREWGAETPFMRPVTLADAHTGVIPVIKHALNWYIEQGVPVEYACCIYAAAPFIRSSDLANGYRLLVDSRKSFSLAVTSYAFPIQRALRLASDGSLEPVDRSYMETRSQDLEERFHDAGQFCWGTTPAFLSDVSVYSSQAVPIVLPRYLVQDIDTLEDWVCAESMYRSLGTMAETEVGDGDA